MLKIKQDPLAAPTLPGMVGAGALTVIAAGLAAGVIPPPNLDLLAQVSPVVLIHLVAALAALAIGTALLVGRKGRSLHRVLGWTWVWMMAVTAGSSMFIRDLNGGALSWIHLLSGWTLVLLPVGVVLARRHKVALHRRTMTGIYVGGLLIAGGFTFLPGRLMWRVFFG